MPEDSPAPRRRRRRSREGEEWDGGAWVDVGSDDKWSPTFAERSRALILLLVLGGILFLAAAVASLGEDDGEGEVTTATTTTTTSAPTSTSTTAVVLDPASLAGDAPPSDCVEDDAREAAPLRDRARSTVLVLNGSYRTGHAADTNDDLEELGYTSMQPENAEDVLDETLIEYLPGHCAESVRLFLDLGLPTASVAPFDDAERDVLLGRAVLVVTLGRDST